MARERPGHVYAGQDLVPRHPDALPEGHHPVRVHGIPAVEEDDLVAFHDRADAQEGREVEHEVGAAVDQGDLAPLEWTEDPVQGGHEGREGRTRLEAGLRRDEGLGDEGDGILPSIRWTSRYKVRDGGGMAESTDGGLRTAELPSRPRRTMGRAGMPSWRSIRSSSLFSAARLRSSSSWSFGSSGSPCSRWPRRRPMRCGETSRIEFGRSAIRWTRRRTPSE